MTHKYKNRVEAAEAFIQTIKSMIEISRIKDPVDRARKMGCVEQDMRQVLSQVLCFHIPDPTQKLLPFENKANSQ